MSGRRATPRELPDALREAVERAVQALDERRPATHEDLRALRAELREIGRRLDAIEERLPAAGSGAGRRRTAKPASRPASKGARAKPPEREPGP